MSRIRISEERIDKACAVTHDLRANLTATSHASTKPTDRADMSPMVKIISLSYHFLRASKRGYGLELYRFCRPGTSQATSQDCRTIAWEAVMSEKPTLTDDQRVHPHSPPGI